MIGNVVAGIYGTGAPPIPPSSFESIATSTPSGVSTITFSSIPSTYKHLQVRATTLFGAEAVLDLRLNGDTGSNYTQHGIFGRGAVVAVLGSANTSTVSIMGAYSAIPSGFPCVAIIDIHDYASTTKNKTVRNFSGTNNNTTENRDVCLTSGVWRNTNAVTSVTLFSGTNYTTGTTISLYGIKG
jgi:hypothetical protein